MMESAQLLVFPIKNHYNIEVSIKVNIVIELNQETSGTNCTNWGKARNTLFLLAQYHFSTVSETGHTFP